MNEKQIISYGKRCRYKKKKGQMNNKKKIKMQKKHVKNPESK